MKILYSLCSWGLGHATRGLPVIRRLVRDGHEVVIYTTGRGLSLLKAELGDSCSFIESVPYPSPYSDKFGFAFRFLKVAPRIIRVIKSENLEMKKIIKERGIELIISDSRFGSYSEDVPSFLLFHQLRFIAPCRFFLGEMLTEGFNQGLQYKFNKVLVPDYEDPLSNLSGDLSHNLRYFKKENVEYIGILSDYEKQDVPQDIDYLFSISGPEPTRTVLEEKLFSQISLLKGKIVVAQGKPGEFSMEERGNVTVYSYLEKKRRDELMNRSKMVVSRSGYTTVMDVSEIGRKVLFIPTPGQTEQVYIGQHLNKLKLFYSVAQGKLQLDRDVETARDFPGFIPPWKTGESVERLLKATGIL